MKVNAQFVNFNAESKLKEFIQKRMEKLTLFNDRIICSDVFLKVENTSSKTNKSAEVKLTVPGDNFVVKKTCKSFEEAIDSACGSLRRKLLKKKKKPRVHSDLKFLTNSFV